MISTLDATSKEIITLKTVTGLKHRDIANLLNIPEGTVRWRYRKALDELRTLLRIFFNINACVLDKIYQKKIT